VGFWVRFVGSPMRALAGVTALSSAVAACVTPASNHVEAAHIEHVEDATGAPAPPPASVAQAPAQPPSAPLGPELPRGGRTLFPDYELVGFCGTPGAPALGRLEGNLPQKAKMLQGYADKYPVDRKILPVFELIAVVVQSGAGADGKYRRRVSDSVVEQYLRAARDMKALLLLNIQPGQSDFYTEVRQLEKYLHEPDVGVALDPEWAMKPGQAPGKVYGQTTGEMINKVAEYLSSMVQADHLPEKALVFHQVHTCVVKDEGVVRPFPGVATIKSVDGLGPKAAKIKTYDYLKRFTTAGVHPGFKLFFDEDRQNGGTLMSPAEVLALAPPPEYVMYE
jgi:hypothetical protein